MPPLRKMRLWRPCPNAAQTSAQSLKPTTAPVALFPAGAAADPVVVSGAGGGSVAAGMIRGFG